jgi:hypothetical protein
MLKREGLFDAKRCINVRVGSDPALPPLSRERLLDSNERTIPATIGTSDSCPAETFPRGAVQRI